MSSNVKKVFVKLNWLKSYWAVNFVFSAILLLFLEIWWSLECHIFLTKWGFQKLFSHSSSSLSTLSNLLTCYGISWNLYFAVNLMTPIFAPKTVKIKNPKTYDCWEYKVLLPCKVSAQTVKNWKSRLKMFTFWWQLTRRANNLKTKSKFWPTKILNFVLSMDCLHKIRKSWSAYNIQVLIFM